MGILDGISRSVDRQFDDEPGGGIVDQAATFVGPGGQEEIADDLGVDYDEDSAPQQTGNVAGIGNAITGVGGSAMALGGLSRLGSIGSKAGSAIDDIPNAGKLFGGGVLGGIALDDAAEGGLPNPLPPLLPSDQQGGSGGGGGSGGPNLSLFAVAGLALVAVGWLAGDDE